MNEIDRKLKEAKGYFAVYLSDVPYEDTDQFVDDVEGHREASAFYNGFMAGKDSNEIDLDNLPVIPGYDREAQKSIVKYLTTGEADMWEFRDLNYADKWIMAKLTHYNGVTYKSDMDGYQFAYARPVKPFDTRLGKLTDADSYNGNTPDRRPLVTVGNPYHVGKLFGVVGNMASVNYDENSHGLPRLSDLRLATREEVESAGHPREWAGLREGE